MTEEEYKADLEKEEQEQELSAGAKKVYWNMRSESGVEFAPWMNVDAEAVARAEAERKARKERQALLAQDLDSMSIDPQAAELGAGALLALMQPGPARCTRAGRATHQEAHRAAPAPTHSLAQVAVSSLRSFRRRRLSSSGLRATRRATRASSSSGGRAVRTRSKTWPRTTTLRRSSRRASRAAATSTSTTRCRIRARGSTASSTATRPASARASARSWSRLTRRASRPSPSSSPASSASSLSRSSPSASPPTPSRPPQAAVPASRPRTTVLLNYPETPARASRLLGSPPTPPAEGAPVCRACLHESVSPGAWCSRRELVRAPSSGTLRLRCRVGSLPCPERPSRPSVVLLRPENRWSLVLRFPPPSGLRVPRVGGWDGLTHDLTAHFHTVRPFSPPRN